MINNEGYRFFEEVFLRAPFYSFQNYAPDKVALILKEKIFRDSLWLASPALYKGLQKKDFSYELLDNRERFTVLKYYNRMCFRPTPFGAFASFTLVRWSGNRQLHLVRGENAMLNLLPAWQWQESLKRVLALRKENSLFALNPTLYRLGADWRYTKSEAGPAGRLFFSVAAIAAGEVNNKLIGIVSAGTVKRQVLEKELLKRTGCTRKEAADYITFLRNEQVLLSPGAGTLLESPGDFKRFPALLKELWHYGESRMLKDFPSAALFAERINEAGRIYGVVPDNNNFYAALQRPSLQGGVDQGLQEEILSVVNLLQRIVVSFPARHLRDFTLAFSERFGTRKVPLLIALDPDAGISYGRLHLDPDEDGLLGGVAFPVEKPGDRPEMQWSAIHRFFMHIWLRNGKRGTFDPVVLRDEEVQALESPPEDLQLPPSLPVMFSKRAGKLVLDAAGGATAISLLGRFSLFSTPVYRLCRKIARAEAIANPGVLFAELHQLTHGHVDNINRRRQIYDYVIPLNVFPSSPAGGEILPADLVLSVRGGMLVMESLTHAKRVIPRLPTAYNYHHNDLALFRFLCDLQYQQLRAELSFDPEKLFPGLEYYPRFEYRDTIISLARWHLRENELNMLSARPSSLGCLHLFRQERGIPRHVTLGRGDQQLVFDLGNDMEALFFLDCLKERGTAVVREYLVPDKSVVSGGKAYAGQFIAVLTREKLVYAGVEIQKSNGSAVQRSFPPGSEWLYIKLYCTPQSADYLLLELVVPFLKKNRHNFRSWFFIRYQDPEYHLRLRISGGVEELAAIFAGLSERFNHARFRGLVRSYKTDTYEREIERYSPQLIAGVESLFYTGSEWTLFYLKDPANQQQPFLLIYRMCKFFIDEQQELVAFLLRMKFAYFREFKGDNKLKLDFDRKYRALFPALALLLKDGAANTAMPNQVTANVLAALMPLKQGAADWEQNRREQLLADLVHMQVNRIFASRQREHEGFIYHCLHKYAGSLMARSKNQ